MAIKGHLPIINAHFLGDFSIQAYQDAGPGEIYMDIINPGDEDYQRVAVMIERGVMDAPNVYPERPSSHHVWENGSWVDLHTTEWTNEELERRREKTQLDKSDLLIRLATGGILTPEEADEAAGGIIPASMVPMMDSLPPEAKMAAKIKWKSDNVISRKHPVIIAAAYAMGISDEQLDAIFGVPPIVG